MKHEATEVRLSDLVGDVAGDKDAARAIRVEVLLPALAKHRSVVLDFSGVRVATHSFVHACIAEAFRKFGDEAVRLVEFHGCGPAVRTMVQTVVDYSLEFAAFRVIQDSSRIETGEIPQADDLRKVRRVVEALAGGAANVSDLACVTGFSERHVCYRIASARILGLVVGTESFALTDTANQLLATTVGTLEERRLLLALLQETTVFKQIVPDLLESPPPERRTVAARIARATGLGYGTSFRRAATLSSWRRQLTLQQLSLGLE